jgi:upstream activation factor subunit UAF30
MTTDIYKATVFDKMKKIMEDNTEDIHQLRLKIDGMKTRQKALTKLFAKMQSKSVKPMKARANRKPCGFARPTPVSNEMCDFLKITNGTEVSRTTVTRALIQYIKDKNLQNPQNKKQILPDVTLYDLFGEDAKTQTLTYFTMQKYVNHHFKPKKVAPTGEVSTTTTTVSETETAPPS